MHYGLVLYSTMSMIRQHQRSLKSKYCKPYTHLQAVVLPLYTATVTELHISNGSELVWNLCLRLRDQTARVRCERLNVSLRSVCLRLNSCLALVLALNHNHLFKLLSALPKKDRLKRPPSHPSHVLLCLVYSSALSITLVGFLGIRLLLLTCLNVLGQFVF